VAHLDGMSLQNFKIFRALGLAFRAWFANFIPITLLAAILYSPVLVLAAQLPGPEAVATHSRKEMFDLYLVFFERVSWVLVGAGTLLAPLVTYRVVQWMNGKRASIWTSLKFGVRGIVPAIMIAAVTSLLGLIPYGVVIGIIISCIFFVAAPAAVAEKLGPINALWRAARLTDSRRGGIFVIYFLMVLAVFLVMFAAISPLMEGNHTNPIEGLETLKRTIAILVATMAVMHLVTGLVQAVSYALLRTDKDGISNEELATVFD
jgi:hypothetical protein